MEKLINKLKECGWKHVEDPTKELWYKSGYMLDLINTENTGIARIRIKTGRELYETIANVQVIEGEINWLTLNHFNNHVDEAEYNIKRMLK